MSETIRLKCVGRENFLDEILVKWVEPNENFLVEKRFAEDRSSVELKFIDEQSKGEAFRSLFFSEVRRFFCEERI